MEYIICVVSPSASIAMTDWLKLICGLPETRDRIKVKLAEWIDSPESEDYNPTYSCVKTSRSGEPIEQNLLNFVKRWTA